MTWLQKHMDRIARAPDDGAGAAAGGAAAGAGDNNGAGAAAGGGQKPWYDGIDPETVGHWDNKGWKKDDPKEIALQATKAARELQKHFGVPAEQIIKLPKDTTDEAGWKGVYQRLGAPADPKGYDLSAIKINGQDLDPAFADKVRAALFTAGVAKDKAPTIVKAMAEQREAEIRAGSDEAAAKLQADRAALMKEWGPNGEFNRLTAMQGAKRLGVSEEDVAKMEAVVGYKRTMEIFHKIGAGTTEDSFHDTNNGGNPTTRNGAVSRLDELKSDPAWADRLLKGDATAKREFENLMQMIHGVAA